MKLRTESIVWFPHDTLFAQIKKVHTTELDPLTEQFNNSRLQACSAILWLQLKPQASNLPALIVPHSSSPSRAALIKTKRSAGLRINHQSSSLTTIHHTSNTINIHASVWQKSVIYILFWETVFAFISVVHRDIQLAVLALHFSTDVSNTLVALLHLCQAGWDPPLSCDE